MSQPHDLDDLSVLARRGELARREEQELEAALARAPTERFLHEAGRGFDLEGTVLVEDEQLLERMKARLGRKPAQRPVVARWRFALGVAAGLALAATAALGVELTRAWLRPTTTARAPARPSVEDELVAPRAVVRSKSSADAVVEPAPPVVARATSSKPRPLPASAPLEVAPPRAAAELFAAANRARSRGDVALAMALYRELQAEHRGSAEATASLLSLGMLQLKRGEAAGALEQLRAFRQASPQAMTAEALFGEAEAYRQLGRQNEERRALEDLVTRYPRSAYAVAAAKRLEQDQ